MKIKPVEHSPIRVPAKIHIIPIRSIVINVFVNGKNLDSPHRIALSPRVLKRMDLVLREVDDHVKGVGGATTFLYAVDGKKLITQPSELVHGGTYVLVGNEPGGFQPLCYGCLLKPKRPKRLAPIKTKRKRVRKKIEEKVVASTDIQPIDDESAVAAQGDKLGGTSKEVIALLLNAAPSAGEVIPAVPSWDSVELAAEVEPKAESSMGTAIYKTRFADGVKSETQVELIGKTSSGKTLPKTRSADSVKSGTQVEPAAKVSAGKTISKTRSADAVQSGIRAEGTASEKLSPASLTKVKPLEKSQSAEMLSSASTDSATQTSGNFGQVPDKPADKQVSQQEVLITAEVKDKLDVEVNEVMNDVEEEQDTGISEQEAEAKEEEAEDKTTQDEKKPGLTASQTEAVSLFITKLLSDVMSRPELYETEKIDHSGSIENMANANDELDTTNINETDSKKNGQLTKARTVDVDEESPDSSTSSLAKGPEKAKSTEKPPGEDKDERLSPKITGQLLQKRSYTIAEEEDEDQTGQGPPPSKDSQ